MQQIAAQNYYFVPHLGIKADVNRNNFDYSSDEYFKLSSSNLTFKSLSSLVLGFNFEYKNQKKIYGFGLIIGDYANSELSVKFNQNTSNISTPIIYTNNAGWPIFAKIPLIYKTELFSIKDEEDLSKQKVVFNLNTGVNLQFLKVKKQPVLLNPTSFGKTLTDYGDYIEIIGYDSQLQRKFNMSINIGLDMDFYLKGERRAILQLYFEQGFRKISASGFEFYLNNKIAGGVASFSRGSALNFKLAFPVKILQKHTN